MTITTICKINVLNKIQKQISTTQPLPSPPTIKKTQKTKQNEKQQQQNKNKLFSFLFPPSILHSGPRKGVTHWQRSTMRRCWEPVTAGAHYLITWILSAMATDAFKVPTTRGEARCAKTSVSLPFIIACGRNYPMFWSSLLMVNIYIFCTFSSLSFNLHLSVFAHYFKQLYWRLNGKIVLSYIVARWSEPIPKTRQKKSSNLVAVLHCIQGAAVV